jgi:hypothetical protein
MSGWDRGTRSPLRRAVFAGIVVAVGISLASSWIGCGKHASDMGDHTKQNTQLAARLAGEWVSKDDETVTVFFTDGTNKLVYSYTEKVKLPMQSRLDAPVYTGEMKKHSDTHEIESFGDRSITMKKNGLGVVVVEFEFSSDDEFVAIYKCEWDTPPRLKGRFRRAVPRPTAPVLDSSPIAEAKKQVERIEQKLVKVETLQRQAQQERDEMVAKLRELGIENATDLKKNPRGQRMAENLAKLSAEIDGMGAQLATIDTELLKARSIVRRMEREQAGISDDEMRQLSQQLREAESKTDAAPRTITPVDVDAALEAAFKARKPSPR